MATAKDLAEQAVNNVWLTLLQRVMSVVVAPLIIVATISYMNLRDRLSTAEGDLIVQRGRSSALELQTVSLRVDLTAQGLAVARLIAQRESDANIVSSIENLRGDLRSSVASTNARIDGMMTPPVRGRP